MHHFSMIDIYIAVNFITIDAPYTLILYNN